MAEKKKATKAEAEYEKGTPHKHCGLCTMFEPPHGCSAVEGKIEAYDVCKFFKRAFSRHERWYGGKDHDHG